MRHYILFFIFSIVFPALSLGQDFSFSTKLLTSKDGLVDNNVNDIIQDHYGYMWFGTRNGLSCYDGYRFVNYSSDQENSISFNYIRSLNESPDHILWISTFGGGLCAYDHKKEKFTHFPFAPSDSIMPESNVFNNTLPERIYYTLSNTPGELWVATQIGLYHLSYSIEPTLQITAIKRYMASASDNNSLADNKCFHLMFDHNNQLWIASNEGGITRFDVEKNRFTRYTKSSKKGALPSNQIMFTFQDSRKQIWAGTWESGLCLYLPESDSFIQYKNKENHNSISGNNVYKITEDKLGNLWFGITYAGLDRLYLPNLNIKEPTFYKHWEQDNSKNLASSNVILSTYTSRDGVIWVSSLGIGINKITVNSNNFQRFYSDRNNPKSLSGNDVTAISLAPDGNLWVGTWENGINIVTNQNTSLEVIKKYKKTSPYTGLFSNSIYDIYFDSNETPWIGTWEGLNKVELKNNQATFKRVYFKNQPKENQITNIITIHEDRNKTLWVGTHNKGLAFLNKEENNLIPFSEHPLFTNENTLSNPQIYCLISIPGNSPNVNHELWIGTNHGLNRLQFCDTQITNTKYFNHQHPELLSDEIKNFIHSDSILYIGTAAGLCAFNLKQESFSKLEAIKGQYIMTLQKDHSDAIWIGSYAGISRYTPWKESLQKYYEYSSGQTYGYNHRANAIDNKGTCYIGTNGGLYYYTPDTSKQVVQNKVYFTDFKLNGKRVSPDNDEKSRKILSTSIKETQEITLKHSDKNFTIEFASLNYNNEKSNHFAYKLKEINSSWSYTSLERAFATYTDLPHGEYTLCVKARNNDESWSKNISTIKINILPPFWKTPWAYAIYSLLIILVLVSYRRYTINKVKLQEAVRFEKFKREKEEELNQQRIQFFTNISHELRTPLTLISGPLEQAIQQSTEQEVKDKLNVIKNNSTKLLNLINELLDFRKIELGKARLYASEQDVVAALSQLYKIFEHKANEESIYYRFKTKIDYQPLWFDHDKLDKIVSNLLSNAFKYTPSNGKISLKLKIGNIQAEKKQKFDVLYGELPCDDFAQISISDNGEGISKKDTQHIFERFYRVKGSSTEKQGSGIGLSFVKDLVLLHQGQIGVFSKAGKGSVFIIRLPLGRSHLSPNQIKYETDTTDEIIPKNIDIALTKSSEAPKILVVEDNPEMRKFITGILDPYFKVIQAEHGKEGLSLAKEVVPDLVISDVMMPIMDGIEFCKNLKKPIETSHIPVILLTAKSSIENNIEGFEAGADDYISKPFSPELLLLKVRNRFETRKKLIERYSGDVFAQHSTLTSNSTDEQFLSDFIKFINQNLEKESMDIVSLAENFGMSKSTFTRKLRQLTNQSPADFINTYRMKLAAQLLLSKRHTIKEVAFKVGFGDARYFSTRFKKHFEMTPTEYIEKANANQS